jgi:hypothetical protein
MLPASLWKDPGFHSLDRFPALTSDRQ